MLGYWFRGLVSGLTMRARAPLGLTKNRAHSNSQLANFFSSENANRNFFVETKEKLFFSLDETIPRNLFLGVNEKLEIKNFFCEKDSDKNLTDRSNLTQDDR